MVVTHKMKQYTKHTTNALHIYCRLRDMGLSRKKAAKLARFYEHIVHPIIYMGVK